MTLNDLTKQLSDDAQRINANTVILDHFIWTADGTRILGITPMGRATCDRLDMNDDRYQGERSIVEARTLWIEAGWHPPDEDPRQTDGDR
ncbi:MAG: hypothetical protein KME10_20715 [Plectolyngbya sp. WJT66-NPBG17]|jgi:hypothetical protein|nr:hypothetical protein [Plectolyngbya sp. WJT66-NPBG17]MBW4527163.1 hypothetical protein [Phormidium tanganyikae FI6-MK23]